MQKGDETCWLTCTSVCVLHSTCALTKDGSVLSKDSDEIHLSDANCDVTYNHRVNFFVSDFCVRLVFGGVGWYLLDQFPFVFDIITFCSHR